jgi:hypothetical protein
LSVVGCWLLVVGCWLLVVGCWLLVVGCWLLVVGCWLLVVGCWLLQLRDAGMISEDRLGDIVGRRDAEQSRRTQFVGAAGAGTVSSSSEVVALARIPRRMMLIHSGKAEAGLDRNDRPRWLLCWLSIRVRVCRWTQSAVPLDVLQSGKSVLVPHPQ